MNWRPAALWSSIGLVLLTLATAAALYWASRSEVVLRWGVERFAGRLPCLLSVEGLRGSLAAPLRAQRIICENAELRFEVRGVELDWSPWMLLQERLEVTRLQAQMVEVDSRGAGGTLPADLGLPLAVKVSVLEIGIVTWSSGGRTLAFRDLTATYESDARTHRLGVRRLASDQGSLGGELVLGTRPPFPLSGRLLVESQRIENRPLNAALQLSGTLADLQVQAAATVGALAVTASLGLAPFEDDPLRSFAARSDNVDLSAFDQKLPRTALMVEIEGAGRGLEKLTGRLRAVNAEPGSLDLGRLPLRQVDSTFSATAESLDLGDALFDLGSAGRAEGRVSIASGQIRLNLEVRALDLRALHGELRSTRLAGALQVESRADAQRIVADLREKTIRFQGRVEVRAQSARIEHLLAQAGGAQMTASGVVELKDGMKWKAQGRLRSFDPARFGDFPSARINGSVEAAGVIRPQWQVDLSYALSSSRFRGQPLRGAGRMSLSASRASGADARLTLGGNRIQVKGAFGSTGDSFSFEIDAPRLAALGLGFEGSLRAAGTVTGTPQRPALEIEAEALALDYHGFKADRWTVRARLEQAEDPRVDLHIRATRASRGPIALDDLTIDAAGLLRAHAVEIAATSARVHLTGRLEGGWAAATHSWEGVLESLESRGEYAFRLIEPAKLEVARDRALLGAAAIQFEQTRITLAQTRYRDGAIVASGSVSGVRAARLLALTGSSSGIETTLVLGGRWSIDAGETVNGFIELGRESGDVVVVAEEPLALGLREARLELRAAANRLSGRLTLEGEGLSAQGEAQSVLQRRGAAWGLSGAAPLRVEARATLQSIRPFVALANRDIAAGGSMLLEVRGEGTVAEPKLRGSLTAGRIRIENVESGVFLRDGTLRATFGGEGIEIDEFIIKGGEGTFSAKAGSDHAPANPMSISTGRRRSLQWFSTRTFGSPFLVPASSG